MPDTVPRYAGRHPPVAESRIQGELHAAGLKPTEGRLSHHTITMENLKFGMSLSWNVAKEWLDERNFDTIREIVRIMGK